MGACFKEAKSRIMGCLGDLLEQSEDYFKLIENLLSDITNLNSNKETKEKESPDKDDFEKMKKVCSYLQFLSELPEFVNDDLLTLRQTLNEVKQNRSCLAVAKLIKQLSEIIEFLKKVYELFNDDDKEEERDDLEEQRLKLISEFLEKRGRKQEEFDRKVEEKMREIMFTGILLTLTSAGN